LKTHYFQGVFYVFFMILLDELSPIGYIHKLHGVKGELMVLLTVNLQSFEHDFLILEIDGIYVPFFIKSKLVKKDHSALLTFEGISSAEKGKRLIGKTIYLPKHAVQIAIAPPQSQIHQLIGYTIIDRIKGEIGIIEAIEDATENILFVVSYQNTELLIPVVEEFIEKIDDRKKAIITQLPIGLLDLNQKE
jgi:16S rRNA processing protein RimM